MDFYNSVAFEKARDEFIFTWNCMDIEIDSWWMDRYIINGERMNIRWLEDRLMDSYM